MRKWLFRIVWIPALAIAVLFLVANRQLVAVSLDPFNAQAPALTSPALPLWAWLITFLFIGLGAGSFGMWMSARPRRVEARADRKEARELRKQVTRLETELKEARAGRQRDGERPDAEQPPLLESQDA